MYVLKPGIKADRQRRWALPDRIFFGHGACHILAGVFLRHPPVDGFVAVRIVPAPGFAGNHVFVSDGTIAFDHHGHTARRRLLDHHRRGWAARCPGWDCTVETVDFDLLDTAELNRRRMLGPDQYLFDPVPRARAFIGRIDHHAAMAKASRTFPVAAASPRHLFQEPGFPAS